MKNKRKQNMLHEQHKRRSGKKSEYRNRPIMSAIFDTFLNPRFLFSSFLGALFAHYVLTPLFFR